TTSAVITGFAIQGRSTIFNSELFLLVNLF
ncbi:MAG: hypothetical protein ACI8QG_002422, partial [Flavobacteriales bacterium]